MPGALIKVRAEFKTRQNVGGFVLHLDGRIDSAPAGPVEVSLGGAKLDLGAQIRGANLGVPFETRIPLRCFQDAGADLNSVGPPCAFLLKKVSP